MRTTEQLLKLVLKQGNLNFEKGNPYYTLYENGYKGLCGFVGDLRDRDIITNNECDILIHFIGENKPTEQSPYYYKEPILLYQFQAYYWPKGEWKPRKAWLEDQIKYIK